MEDLKSLIEIMKDMTPEQRDKFIDLILKLIENDDIGLYFGRPVWIYPYKVYDNPFIDFDSVYPQTIASGDNYFLFTAE